MNIILVRHGKAKDRIEGKDDPSRPLTSKGKRQIRDITPIIKENTPGEAYIWSSPYKRALESAEIISEALNREIFCFDFLIEGNYQEFINRLESLNEDTTIIVTGHEPWLSEWSLDLCGRRLKFRKGTAAFFKKRNGEMELKQIADSFTVHKNADDPVLIMGACLDEIEALEEKYQLDSSDIENVHGIRVRLRRIRSILSFIKPLLPGDDYLKYKNGLGNAAQRFSRLRQLDVLYEQWLDIISNSGLLLKDGSSLAFVLNQEREKEAKSLRKYITEGCINDQLRAASTWIRSLDIDLDKYHTLGAPRISKWNRQAKKIYGGVDFNSLEQVHSLRIRYKKLRYAAETLGLSKQKALAEIQERLGIICDSFLNLELLNGICKWQQSAELQYEIGVFTGFQISERQRAIEKLKEIL